MPSDANGLVVITQLQPITVVFTIPEDNLPRVMKRLAAGDAISVEAFDRDGKARLATGKLVTVDNQIDPTTGTVKLKAEFPNTDNALFPNQFVNVRMVLETQRDATLVPTAAIQRGAPGTFVFVVKGTRPVSVAAGQARAGAGRSRRRSTAASPPATLVVVDGADKLREGAKVELDHARRARAALRRRAARQRVPAAARAPGDGQRAPQQGRRLTAASACRDANRRAR